MENHKDLRNLVDQFSKQKAALKSLKQPVEYWDKLLIYVISKKFNRNWIENSLHLTYVCSCVSFGLFI